MEWEIILFIGMVAVLYSSVGHGGASGYLAIMALYSMSPETMRPTALVLNLLVSGIAFIQFYRAGYFDRSLVFPFLIGSVPAAFIGGMIDLPVTVYKIILGICLLLAVIRMIVKMPSPEHPVLEKNVWIAIVFGFAIGLVSGLIGIGGGIILSPVILLLGWGDMKKTAAASALFIWLNSLAGLTGFFVNSGSLSTSSWPLLIAAGIGGVLGGYLGSVKWSKDALKWALSLVLVAAAMKLVFI